MQTMITSRPHHRNFLYLTLSLLFATALPAQQVEEERGAEPPIDVITVKLVTDFESGELISDRESIIPITKTVYEDNKNIVRTAGSRSELWVRNAHVNYTYFFEKYYEGKYIGRKSSLVIPREKLTPGDHTIYPGEHVFTVADDGMLSSQDPEIRIDGDVVMLRCHKVNIFAVDALKSGPPRFRYIASQLLLFSTEPGLELDADALPLAKTLEGQLQGDVKQGQIYNLLSHSEDFYPLAIWLPSNQVNKGYLTLPSWQTFTVTPEGKVELNVKDSPQVPEVTAQGPDLIIPYRKMYGRVNSVSSLSAVVGPLSLVDRHQQGEKVLQFGSTLEPIVFKAGFSGKKDLDLSLSVNRDLSKRPNKYFLADNLTSNIDAVRLVLGEWDNPVFESGGTETLSVQLKQSPDHITVQDPVIQMSISSYHRSNPMGRNWESVKVLDWKDNLVRFDVPNREYGFYVLRVEVNDRKQMEPIPSLTFEIKSAIIPTGQTGSASFSANKGRDAFVRGEDIRLRLIIRSPEARTPSDVTVVMTLPNGETRPLQVRDPGQAWQEIDLRIPAELSGKLPKGAYTLGMENLPNGISTFPFHFDLVPKERASDYLVVKSSKYTKSMTLLLSSHWDSRHDPIDIDRAVKTIADLGYNRIDNMQYTSDHHIRPNKWREELAESDPRLPSASAVYTPSPRNQMLNACVREQIEFSDVLVYYHDFHLPRYIEGFIRACERWLAREVQSMRHSPAMDGMMLYDEMYDWASSGGGPNHQQIFSTIRDEIATETLGKRPAKIESEINRYMSRPKNQRDPEAMQDFLAWKDWDQHGWGDWTSRMAKVGHDLLPGSRYGTYHRTFMGAGNSDTIQNGYPSDLFKDLDLISQVHYADNSTGWVNIPMLAQILRVDKDKPLYLNIPLSHEGRTHWDGQYQRQMAFALMAQGANGIAQWGLPANFKDEANPGTLVGMETTRQLNENVLQVFGPIINQTEDGYRKVGIISTLNQQATTTYKEHNVSGQTELLWTALWRMGYAPVFIREKELDKLEELSGFQAIFAPGFYFDGELSERQLKNLEAAVNLGTKVIVEKGNALSQTLPGVIQLEDYEFDGYGLDGYFANWQDDELEKIYSLSQDAVDYLTPKMVEWGIEPAAEGPFKVGPNWRQSGDIHYLFMANFDDPDYGHTVKQQMAKPVLIPMNVPARHGNVAYDLLREQPIPLTNTILQTGKPARAFEMDMLRIQGGIMAFLTEPVKNFSLSWSLSADKTTLRLEGSLQGANPISGSFPVTITIGDNTYYRMLGGEPLELEVPEAGNQIACTIREAVSGREVGFTLTDIAIPEQAIVVDDTPVRVPYPDEVRSFLSSSTSAKTVRIIYSELSGFKPAAEKLARLLKAKGITSELMEENDAIHFPVPDFDKFAPYADGFHAWNSSVAIYQPAMSVEGYSILLSGASGSFVFDAIRDAGFLTQLPDGQLGQYTKPMIQVAARALDPIRSTLCLIANDDRGMNLAIQTFLNLPKATENKLLASRTSFGNATTLQSDKTTPIPSALSYMGSNEFIQDMATDINGNLYIITWGHGDNLYSYTPTGEFRFSHYLPEMGANDLRVYDDRILVYTSAGAKLYRLDLNGTPVSQVQLNRDPGRLSYRDNFSLSTISYAYIPRFKKLLHMEDEVARVFDEDYNLTSEWKGKEYREVDVSDKPMYRTLLNFVLSPDGSLIAQLEKSMYYTPDGPARSIEVYDANVVIRNLQGELLHEYEKVENTIGRIKSTITWEPGQPGPVVKNSKIEIAFDSDLNVLSEVYPKPFDGFLLDHGLVLERDGRRYVQLDRDGNVVQWIGPFEVMPTVVQLAGDHQTIACLDENGRLTTWADSKLLTSIHVKERGLVLRFSHDSKTLYIGSVRGTLTAYDVRGAELWEESLTKQNTHVLKPLKLYDPAFTDLTNKVWPKQLDYSGELDERVRMSKNLWPSETSFTVGQDMVGAELTRYLGTHATWVLEFRYKADGKEPASLTAGIRTESLHPDSVASTFPAGPDWQFGRVVIKNGRECKALKVGFVAKEGTIAIDQVQFRQIRFPSVNHMLYDPLYDLEPVILDSPYYITKYDAVGNLREEAPNKILITKTINGSPNLAEPAYLQNGRLNDMGKTWYIQPRSTPEYVSLGLKDPQWLSTLALYFNAYDPEHTTRHFDIYVTDMEAGEEKRVASVRNNLQTFRLIKFPPVLSSMVRIHMVGSSKRFRTLTEVELYGPLSGKEGTPGFTDPQGNNAYMGDFSRVDKRKKILSDAFGGTFSRRREHREDRGWYGPLSTPLISQNKLVVGTTFGASTAYDLTLDKKMQNPGKELYWESGASLGYVPEAVLYGGLVLRAGLDGKLYCISADTGVTLWSVQLGERLASSPVVIGEDIYAANETGKVFQLDMANGSIIKETSVGSGVFGHLATDNQLIYLITEKGKLIALDKESLDRKWTLAVAPYTDSTPAVNQGVVYLGDQKGTLYAVNASNGSINWKTELGDEFTRCPVVTSSKVVVGCRGGTLAVLDRASGSVIWKKQVESRFSYEPMVFENELLYFERGNVDEDNKKPEKYFAMIADLSDGATRKLTWFGKDNPKNEPSEHDYTLPDDPVSSLGYYEGRIFVFPRHGDQGHDNYKVNIRWHITHGTWEMLIPESDMSNESKSRKE